MCECNSVIVMAILNVRSITKPRIVASSALPNDSAPSNSPETNLNRTRLPKANNRRKPQLNMKQTQTKQPSILEIERAIGAGIFRDRDANSEAEEKTSLFGNVLKNTVGEKEGSVEKKLRETGEWLIQQNDKASNTIGKQILVSLFVWILPMWILAFLVAAGIVQLPFLEDIVS